MAQRSLLLLFFGDPTGDRRARNFKRYFEEQGWSVELIGIQPKATGGPRMFLEFYRRLHRASRNKKADVVIACDLFSLSSARWLKVHGRAKYLVYDAREIYTELPAVAHKPLSKIVWRSLERKGLASTDVIVVTGPQDAQAICDVHSFLPRSVLVRNLPWLEDNIVHDWASLEKFGIPPNSKVAIYVGGLLGGRALERTVEAIRELTDVHLLMIGAGPMRGRLESLGEKLEIADRIHFTGPLPPDEAMRVAAVCNIGMALVEPVSKSYELALPSKLFEYMMCGIPVVSSNLTQVIELFSNEPWITYADPIGSKSIAEAIRKGLASSSSENSARERSLSLSEYHFERDAASLDEALKNVQ